MQALALETAEAYAELLHAQLRSMWGFPDAPEMTMLERFRAEYPGKRYSFGYPACPRLEDQQQLFAALKPEEIGVQLTDGCMMEPEASRLGAGLPPPGRVLLLGDVASRDGPGAPHRDAMPATSSRCSPACATTGIGSLPHTQLELALQTALPGGHARTCRSCRRRHPAELMIPAALEGLPGLHFDGEDGVCTVDVGGLGGGPAAASRPLDAALPADELRVLRADASALPRLAARSSGRWRTGSWPSPRRSSPGPATVRWIARLTTGEPCPTIPGWTRRRSGWCWLRALALVQAVRAAGRDAGLLPGRAGPLRPRTADPRHLVVLTELRLLVAALRAEGALVGLHCCGNTEWSALLDLGSICCPWTCASRWTPSSRSRGRCGASSTAAGAFSLGLVPTDLGQEADPEELARAVETSFAAALPDRPEALRHFVATPACGLAMRSVLEAERIFAQLRAARSGLLR